MRSPHPNPYVDSSPAGDPTYDPRGTSRPFRPTHRRALKSQTPSYRKQVPTLRSRVIEAIKNSLDGELNGRPHLPVLNPKIYIATGVVGTIFVLLVGASVFAPSFPAKTIQTSYAASESKTQSQSKSSSAIGKPVVNNTANVASKSTAAPGVDEINKHTMALYVDAAHSCNMPWQVLAAVGRVETNHGKSTAAGVASGANYAGAKGPMQFIQSTWNSYGIDADHNGKADVYNETDSIYSAAGYLCANGARDNADIGNALYHYNHSNDYVALVERTADGYNNAAYFSPIPVGAVSNDALSSPHHDYAAIDIPVSVGTSVFAVHKGTVKQINDSTCGFGIELTGSDGVRYTYCHASQLLVKNGTVDAGAEIMKSGGQPGQAGAGDSTGPHLHFAVSVNGHNICPQTLVQNWNAGNYADPHEVTNTNCAY